MKLRSEMQDLRDRQAQTRREIDIALDLLHEAFDAMSSGVFEEAGPYISRAIERLCSLFEDASLLDLN